jgi:SsrA-binding protein
VKIINRKASYNYEILEKFEAGISLFGMEVKSVKLGRIKLDEAFVKNINGELWLVNAHIPAYQFADSRNYDSNRSRKLLLHRQEILSLQKKIEGRNLTIVPISCYNKGRKIKIGIAIARGKKQWEKREKIKKEDINREVERTLKYR